MSATATRITRRVSDANFIASLSHGLSVLEAVAESADDVPLARLVSLVGLKKTSTWRLVHTLVKLGYVRQDRQTKRFRPASRVLSLGYAYLDGLDFKHVASPILHALSMRTNETVILSTLAGDELIYIDRIRTSHLINVNLTVGSRLPLYNTAQGRVLISEKPEDWLRPYLARLAGDQKAKEYAQNRGKKLRRMLEDTRRLGYSISVEEYADGLCGVARPIRDRSNSIIAAVCIAVPSGRATRSKLRDIFAPELLRSTDEISQALGFRKKR